MPALCRQKPSCSFCVSCLSFVVVVVAAAAVVVCVFWWGRLFIKASFLPSLLLLLLLLLLLFLYSIFLSIVSFLSFLPPFINFLGLPPPNPLQNSKPLPSSAHLKTKRQPQARTRHSIHGTSHALDFRLISFKTTRDEIIALLGSPDIDFV